MRAVAAAAVSRAHDRPGPGLSQLDTAAPSDGGPTRANQCEHDRRGDCVILYVLYARPSVRPSGSRSRSRSFHSGGDDDDDDAVCFLLRATPPPSPPPVTRGARPRGDIMEVKKRYIWSDRETEHFIRLIIDMGMTNMLDSKRKRNSDLYSSLVEPMAAAGFNRDATQLRTKWKHLKQDYKVELVRIEKNGASSSRMSYFHLLHEVLSCKPSNAMTYLCEVVSNSPPRLDAVDTIKTEYIEETKMEVDFYRINEPQVDIIQTCDVQTQTETTPGRLQVLQKLQSLEHSIKELREDWRNDRQRQNAMVEKNLRRMLEHQKMLMDDFFTKTKCLLEAKTKD